MILIKQKSEEIGYELTPYEIKRKFNNVDDGYDDYNENYYNDMLHDYSIACLETSISIDEIILYRNCARASNLWASLNLNVINEVFDNLYYVLSEMFNV